MREIIFDTETTGLDKEKDRIIEIGCVEMVNRYLTGRRFHVYLNPQGVIISDEAIAIHGLTNERLKNEKSFNDIVSDFLEFIDGATMIAHNASFDIGFINAELGRVNQPLISVDNILDTLAMARRKFPMGPNSLDALCKRFGIDNSHRVLHGALLDAEILADVYIELIGGKQGVFIFDDNENINTNAKNDKSILYSVSVRPQALSPRLSAKEIDLHADFIKKMGEKALWNHFKIQ
ncbi:DNA polymerase III subunit epsilon [Bartonella sp. B41]